jgi:amidase
MRYKIGLSFKGAKWSKESLISFAYAYEQHIHTREKVRPYLVPNTQLAVVVVQAQRGKRMADRWEARE